MSGTTGIIWVQLGSGLTTVSSCRSIVNSPSFTQARAVLAEDLDLGVDELAVLQHLQAGLRRPYSRARSAGRARTLRARRQTVRADAAHEMRVPFLVLAAGA